MSVFHISALFMYDLFQYCHIQVRPPWGPILQFFRRKTCISKFFRAFSRNLTDFINVMVKQSHCRPGQALRVPGGWGSQISRQLAPEGDKVVTPTHRPPLSPGNIPGTHFCQRLSQPQSQSATGRIMSMKNSSDTIGNRTRDLPACRAVPQPTAPPRAPTDFITPTILDERFRLCNKIMLMVFRFSRHFLPLST